MNPRQRHLYQRPIGVLAVLAALLVLGAMAIPQMRIRLISGGEFSSQIYVSLGVSGLGTLETLDRLTRPAEEIARSQPACGDIETNTSNGTVSLRIQPAKGNTSRTLVSQLTQAFASNKHRFPKEMQAPSIHSWSDSSWPLLVVAINQGDLHEDAFNQLITRGLLPAIQSVPGIAKADTYRQGEPSVRIAFNSFRLGSMGMQVEQAVQAITAASGLSSKNNAPLSLRDESASRQIRIVPPPLTPGTLPSVRIDNKTSLSDIALVEARDPARDEFQLLIDGKPGEGLVVYASADANVYRLSQTISALIDRECEKHGLVKRILFDSHTAFNEIAYEILISAGWCAGFSLLFLVLFLGRWRIAILVCSALPISLILALVAMAIGGQDLNLLSLIGYVLASGMVVDNAIVIAESLMRARSTTDPAERQRVLHSAVRSVAMAIIVATLTTVAMFIPALIADNDIGRLLLVGIGVPIAWSLIASLVVALVLVPMAFSWIYPKGLNPKGRSQNKKIVADGRGHVRWLRAVEIKYGRILAYILLRPALGLSLTLMLVGTGIAALILLERPETRQFNEERSFDISMFANPKISLNDIAAQVKVWNKTLEPLREKLGIICVMANISRNYGNLEIHLQPIDPLQRSSDEIKEAVLIALTSTPDIALQEHHQWASFAADFSKRKAEKEKAEKEKAAELEKKELEKKELEKKELEPGAVKITDHKKSDASETSGKKKDGTPDASEKGPDLRLSSINLTLSAPQPAALALAGQRLMTVIQAEGGAPRKEEAKQERKRGRNDRSDQGTITLRLTRGAEEQGWQANNITQQMVRFTGGERSVEMPGGWFLGYGRNKDADRSLTTLLETVVYQPPTTSSLKPAPKPPAPKPMAAPSATSAILFPNASSTINAKPAVANSTPTIVSAPLLRLVESSSAKSTQSINRKNGLSTSSLSATVLMSEQQRIMNDLPTIIARANIPNGVVVKPQTSNNDMQDSMRWLLIACLLACAIIYLLMCILYESLLAPLTMITTVPAGIVSVLGIYAIAGLPMDPMVMLGLFLLVGIVINHGVVLVDRMAVTVPMHRLTNRSSHRTVHLAIAASARRRFTPVLLTSLTTIAAAVPMAFSHGRILGSPIDSLGLSLGIGLTAATVFTLGVVPIVYQWLALTRTGTITLFSGKKS